MARHLRWMSTVDLPELGAAVPAARGLLPATLGARLPETDDWLNQILALDFSTYMSGSVLTKVDRASMAHGLEVRPPLLDDALVDFAFSLPSRFKLRGRRGKYLLKRAARGQIPDAIIDRPKKGFAIPLAAWLRGPLCRPARRGDRRIAAVGSGARRSGRCSPAGRRSTAPERPIAASRCGPSTSSTAGCAGRAAPSEAREERHQQGEGLRHRRGRSGRGRCRPARGESIGNPTSIESSC